MLILRISLCIILFSMMIFATTTNTASQIGGQQRRNSNSVRKRVKVSSPSKPVKKTSSSVSSLTVSQTEDLAQFQEKDISRLQQVNDHNRQLVSDIVSTYIKSERKRLYYQGFPELALASLEMKGYNRAKSQNLFSKLADHINRDFEKATFRIESDRRHAQSDLSLLRNQGLLNKKSGSSLSNYIDVVASKAPLLYVGAATQNELPQIIRLYLSSKKGTNQSPSTKLSNPLKTTTASTNGDDAMRFVRLALIERMATKDGHFLLRSPPKGSLFRRADQFKTAILQAEQRKNLKRLVKIAAFFILPTAIAIIAISSSK